MKQFYWIQGPSRLIWFVKEENSSETNKQDAHVSSSLRMINIRTDKSTLMARYRTQVVIFSSQTRKLLNYCISRKGKHLVRTLSRGLSSFALESSDNNKNKREALYFYILCTSYSSTDRSGNCKYYIVVSAMQQSIDLARLAVLSAEEAAFLSSSSSSSPAPEDGCMDTLISEITVWKKRGWYCRQGCCLTERCESQPASQPAS